jgi:macrodomain Ter protein organizer (MatP/YcbG family)
MATKKPKGKRMAEKPVRLTEEVHKQLSLLSASWGCTMSDVIASLIAERVPSINEAVSRASELEDILRQAKPDRLN